MTVTLGDVLTLITLLCGFVGSAFWLGRKLQHLESDKVGEDACERHRKELRDDCRDRRQECREARAEAAGGAGS